VIEADTSLATAAPSDVAAVRIEAAGTHSASGADTRSTTRPRAAFDTTTILAVSGAHFVHDVYPAFIGVLLPLLIPKLGISLVTAGLLATTLRWATFVQPVLGWVADRVDTRYWVILPPAVTALAISLLGIAPSPLAVAALLAIVGLSSSVFHPPAGAWVTRAAGSQWGRATSYFMTGGELARAVGPFAMAAVLATVGLGWSWVVVVPGLVTSLGLFWLFARRPGLQVRYATTPLRRAFSVVQRGFLFLAAAGALVATATATLLVFGPTYLVGEGADILFAGAALTSFGLGAAAGAFVGGTLSDRLGRRTVLAASAGIGAPLLGLALLMPPAPIQLAAFALAGLVFLSAGPVQLVMMQELLPENRSVAVALASFTTMVAGALGVVLVGALAEVIGLQAALIVAAASALLALPCIAFLPETRHVSRGHG